jgi:ribosome modulation factor
MKLASADTATYECPHKVRRDLRHAWAAGWDRAREDRHQKGHRNR